MCPCWGRACGVIGDRLAPLGRGEAGVHHGAFGHGLAHGSLTVASCPAEGVLAAYRRMLSR